MFYRLVAYHNTKIERDSLELDRSLSNLENRAKNTKVEDFPNHSLHIEDNFGKTLCVFYKASSGLFEEKVN